MLAKDSTVHLLRSHNQWSLVEILLNPTESEKKEKTFGKNHVNTRNPKQGFGEAQSTRFPFW